MILGTSVSGTFVGCYESVLAWWCVHIFFRSIRLASAFGVKDIFVVSAVALALVSFSCNTSSCPLFPISSSFVATSSSSFIGVNAAYTLPLLES